MPTYYKKNYIVLHHTLTDRDTTTFEAVNNYHKQQWNFKSSLGYYIGYHYFITANGKVYQGRNDWEIGAHCTQQSKNYDGIGICLTGNFDNQNPSQKQLDSLKILIEDLMAKHNIPNQNLKFHRDYATYKSCPGSNIPKDFFDTLLNNNQAYMMRIIRKIGDKDCYAVDKNNRRNLIINWNTYERGIAMGLWSSDVDQVDNLEQFQVGNIIILAPDN